MKYSETTYIYTLSDPRTGEVRYVGKTVKHQLSSRKYHHTNLKTNSGVKRYLCNWIVEVINHGMKPLFEIIDEIPTIEWEFWETHYISLFRSWGFNLTNLTNGGEGHHGRKLPQEVKDKIAKTKASRIYPKVIRTKESIEQSLITKKLNGTYGSGGRFYGKDHPNSRPLYKICPNSLEIIKEYECGNDACRDNGITSASMFRRLNSNFPVRNFYWVYKDKYEEFYTKNSNKSLEERLRKPYIPTETILKICPVTYFIIDKFVSMKAAADSENVNYQGLSLALIYKDRLWRNYIWVYEKDYINLSETDFKNKIIEDIQYKSIEIYLVDSISNLVLKIYPSYKEAAIDNNINKDRMHYLLKNKKEKEGKIFMYKREFNEKIDTK